jgi:protein transport protein SEC24
MGALPCLAPYRPGAGTDKEVALLKPDNQFYKDFALDCSRQQIAVDLFLFSPHYTDVATLSTASLPSLTCRQRWFVRGDVNGATL